MALRPPRKPNDAPAFIERSPRSSPPVVISVNECDPLRDEGIALYRLLLGAGVSAHCRQLMGMCHALEVLPVVCPDVARSTASDIADFAFG